MTKYSSTRKGECVVLGGDPTGLADGGGVRDSGNARVVKRGRDWDFDLADAVNGRHCILWISVMLSRHSSDTCSLDKVTAIVSAERSSSLFNNASFIFSTVLFLYHDDVERNGAGSGCLHVISIEKTVVPAFSSPAVTFRYVYVTVPRPSDISLEVSTHPLSAFGHLSLENYTFRNSSMLEGRRFRSIPPYVTCFGSGRPAGGAFETSAAVCGTPFCALRTLERNWI